MERIKCHLLPLSSLLRLTFQSIPEQNPLNKLRKVGELSVRNLFNNRTCTLSLFQCHIQSYICIIKQTCLNGTAVQ